MLIYARISVIYMYILNILYLPDITTLVNVNYTLYSRTKTTVQLVYHVTHVYQRFRLTNINTIVFTYQNDCLRPIICCSIRLS